MIRFRWTVATAAIVLGGCAPKQTVAVQEPTVLDGTRPSAPETVYVQIKQVAITDEYYMGMSVAAAGWVRHIVPGKTVGFFQPDDAPPALQEVIAKVTRVHGFRPVHQEDFKVVCGPPPRSTGQVTAPTCSMAMAEVIVQFNLIWVVRDSGYVGGLTTQVPRGSTSAETTAFCITIAHHPSGWAAVRSVRVADPLMCRH